MQATAVYTQPTNNGSFIGKLLVIVFLAATAVTGYTIAQGQAVDATPASAEERAAWAQVMAAMPAPPIEQTGDHADRKHPEAEYVRKTCKERGVWQVWRERADRNTFHLLCMDDRGRLMDWIITVEGRRFIEKTAFAPGGGVMKKVLDYVAGKATRFHANW